MESSSFYMNLPSSASLKLFPGNTLSKYTVNLDVLMDFDHDEFEVGLVELQLNSRIKNVTKKDACFSIKMRHKNDEEIDMTRCYTLYKGNDDYVSRDFHKELCCPYVGEKITDILTFIPPQIKNLYVAEDGSVLYLDKNNRFINDQDSNVNVISPTLLNEVMLSLSQNGTITKNTILSQLNNDLGFSQYMENKKIDSNFSLYQWGQLYLKEKFKLILLEIDDENEDNFINVSSRVKEITFPIIYMDEYMTFKPDVYSSSQKLLDRMNSALKASNYYKNLHFKVNAKTSKLLLKGLSEELEQDDLLLTVSNKVSRLLRLPNQHLSGKQLRNCSISPNIEANENVFVFIYCSIIEPTIIGDIRAPLMRTVLISSNPTVSSHVMTFNPIQYLKVKRSYINNITIELRNIEGDLIPLEEGEVDLKLHFRRV